MISTTTTSLCRKGKARSIDLKYDNIIKHGQDEFLLQENIHARSGDTSSDVIEAICFSQK